VPVTEDVVKELIILEVGDVDPATGDPPAVPADGILADQITSIWERYASKSLIYPGLQELYVKRSCIEMVLGVLKARRFDFADNRLGLQVRAQQIVAAYERMYARVTGEIAELEGAAAAVGKGSGSYQAAPIIRSAPIVPCYPPDANWPRYSGTPYAARRGASRSMRR
jgi:hypothetical protein